MIREFRKYATGLLAKLLMLLLAASFVLWGIGDIFRSGSGSNYIARVENRSIGVQEFQQQLQLQLANYRQLLGAEYSPQLIKRLGVPQQILGDMVNNLLLQSEAEALGINISEQDIMKIIRHNEAFRGKNGFDKNMFQATLQRAGINEETYLKSLREQTSANLLLEHLDASSLVSRPLLESIYRLRKETRGASLYIFSPPSVESLAAPDQKALEQYYAEHQEEFKTPEYRKLSYIKLNPVQLEKKIEPAETELRTLYESDKNNYQTPERRSVQQLLYDSKEDAEKANILLQRGLSVEEVSQKMPPSNKELDLGFITSMDLVEAAREPVFSLAEGTYSSVIESAFGWHIFRVNSIETAKIPGFEEIKPELRKHVVESQLEDALYQLSIDIEDQLAAGENLADIAKEMDLPLLESSFFDQKGNLLGKKSSPLPPVKNLVERSFSGDLENTPEFQVGTDGDYYFITLKETKASKLPPLSEVQKQVTLRWKEDNAAHSLSEKVEKAAAALQKGEQDALKGLSYHIEEKERISRNVLAENAESQSIALPQALQEQLFSLKIGSYTNAYPLPNGDWIIARLNTVTPLAKGKLTNDMLASLRNEMNEQYSNELMQLYLAYLRQKYPVEVNQIALRSVLQ